MHLETVDKIGIVISQPKHFYFYEVILDMIDRNDVEFILDDYDVRFYPTVKEIADQNKIHYRIASKIRKKYEYKVILCCKGAGRKGGREAYQFGWPFVSIRQNNFNGKYTNALGWPRNFFTKSIFLFCFAKVTSLFIPNYNEEPKIIGRKPGESRSIRSMIQVIKLKIRRICQKYSKNPLIIDRPIAELIGKKNVLAESSLDGFDPNYPGYPNNQVYDYFFCLNADQKNAVLKNAQKPGILTGYNRYNDPPSKREAFDVIKKRFNLNSNKEIITWLPSSDNAFVYQCFEHVRDLTEDYHVIIRPHPDSWNQNRPEWEEDLWEKMLETGFLIDKEPHLNTIMIHQVSDKIICDSGGPVYSSIYLKKNMFLFNNHRTMNKKRIYMGDLINRVYPNYAPEDLEPGQLKGIFSNPKLWANQIKSINHLYNQLFSGLNKREGSQRASQLLVELLHA